MRTHWSETKNHLEHAKLWSYDDVGVFLLIVVLLGVVLCCLVRFQFQRSELTGPGFDLQITAVASLSLAPYLVLKFRHHQPVLRPLGWVWPRTAHIVVALISGVLLASGVAFYLRFRHQSTQPVAVMELLFLGLLLGPILEESLFRGCLLPLLAQTTSCGIAVILTAILFALFHQPANLAH